MPNVEHVKKALKIATTKVAYDYFFKKLKIPDWIEPLEAENIFQSPPNVCEINGVLQAPFWEPSKYLARMASLAPEKVLSVINKIPTTDNPRIHEDFINAALAMPPEYAKKLKKKAIQSLENPYQLFLPSKVTELVVYFLKEHLTDEAIQLCKSLLDIKDSEKKYQGYEHKFINDWELNEKIKYINSHLESCEVKIKFANLLCNKLKKCIVYDTIDRRVEGFRDYSSSWRQAVINPNNDIDDDARDILINWIIEIYEFVINKKPELINGIVQYLLNQSFPIFSRIALYLSERRLDHQDIVMSLLLNNKLAKSNDVWHEYAILLKNAYSTLSQNNKKLILDFIYKINFYSSNEEEYQEKNKRKQYRFLYLISDHLEIDDKSTFALMHKKYGEIENPTFLIYFTGARWGLSSPITLIDFDKKSVEEISQYLKSWAPTTYGYFSESIEGLANVLQHSVTNRYLEYIPELEKFRFNADLSG